MHISTDRPRWMDVLILVLQVLLALLTGGAGALGLASVQSPGVRAAGLDPSAQWFVILFFVVLALAIVTWLFARWRSNRQDEEGELLDQVLDLVEAVLDALQQETSKRLREIPQADVERAAMRVYQAFIADTPLSIVPETVFVDFVVARWRQLAGVQIEVKRLVA